MVALDMRIGYGWKGCEETSWGYRNILHLHQGNSKTLGKAARGS